MRKHILILAHNYATQFVDINNQYARLFDPALYDVTVAYLTGTPDAQIRERTLAEHVIFLDLPKKHIRALKIMAIKKLLAHCRTHVYDLVICHRYKPSYIMMWVAQFCKIPAIIYVMHELNTMSSLSRRILVTGLIRKNMLFAGVSKAVCDNMRRDLWTLPKTRLATIYNMIDVDLAIPQFMSREDARSTLNIAAEDFVFGNIARLSKNKDHHNLIQAFSLIKPYCPHAKLIIMGDGELDETLNTLVAAYGLTESVHFTGFVKDAFRYMKAFDCFVLTSSQEAFGRVLLEAMIAKLPIIATKVHGIPEVLGDIGILVKAKAPHQFAQTMKQVYIMSEEERAHQGERAYMRCCTHFSIPKFHEQFWRLPIVQAIKG